MLLHHPSSSRVLQDLASCNLSYPLPLEYPLLKQNKKLVEHLITKHGMYVDMNKMEVILRVGTVGVESESGGWRVRQGRGVGLRVRQRGE